MSTARGHPSRLAALAAPATTASPLRRDDDGLGDRSDGRSHSTLPKHEIDRMPGNLPKLGLVTEGAFEHGQSARHGDDV
jgi:hypothetical protein